MRVLGVDPGLQLTGYACVEEADGAGSCALVEAGCIRLGRGRTVPERLVELERDLREVIERLRPDAMGVESLFAHYRHPRTAITLAHARGVILLVGEGSGIEIDEYPPAQVKRALAGTGRASKAQIQQAVKLQLGLSEPPDPPDIADALAVAMCALVRRGGVGDGATKRRSDEGCQAHAKREHAGCRIHEGR